MPKNINSAFRVHRILARAEKLPYTEIVKDVWASVFHLDAQKSKSRDIIVVRMLGLLQDEIRDARDKMSQTAFSEELYADAFGNAQSVTGVDNLVASWHDSKTHLTPETLKSLQFCSEVLPSEERLADQKALDDIAAELQNVLDTLGESGLPDDVQAFIKRQIQIIQDALRDYFVAGVKVFHEALVKAATEAATHPQAAQESVKTEPFQSLKKAWEFIKEVDTGTEIFVKVLTGGAVVAKLLGTIAGSP